VKKSELYGLTGSILLTGLLIFLLFWLVMPGLKQPEEEGIMVSFGEVDMGSGKTETPSAQPVTTPASPPPAPSKPVKQDVLTQDDNSLAIAAQKKKEREEKNALEQKRLEEQRIANEKKRREQEAIDKANAMNGLFGNNNSAGSGTTSGDGRQGNPAGSGNSGGNSWSLNGRSLNGSLVKPSYENDVEGRITVSIRVDENGNVISASIGSPTNISDAATRNAAISAAKRTRFSSGNGTASGSITYNFRLQ
jgi:TonB family protein